MSAPRAPTRRCLLTALAMLPAAGAAATETARLLVPGPESGALALRGQQIVARLPGAATRLEIELLGGPDGVTAANRFATAAAPDGRSLLLLPGLAGQARLVGDKRARFDPAGWLPVCGVAQPVLLGGRLPLPWPGPGSLRLGLAAPEHPVSAALLALDLLGIAAVPVPGLTQAQAEVALAQGTIDAAVLTGADAPARLAALGAHPWLVLGQGGRETLAGVPPAAMPPMASSVMVAALEAALAAARLQAVMVLPALTPADQVALWRGAVQRWLAEEARLPADPTGQALDATLAAPLLVALAPPAPAMQAYRDWLRQRLGWSAE